MPPSYPHMSALEQIDSENVPEHVAIIMDGNGRWAEQQGKQRVFGHINGVESVRESLIAASKAGVKYLTLYAFSTENWSRPKEEVDSLMELLVNTIAKEIDTLNENSVKLATIGNTEALPVSCQTALAEAMQRTAHNHTITLILALNYSSKWEILNAVKKIASSVAEKKLDVEEINEDLVSSYLSTSGIPDPELLIRTSGEHRVSNFLLWQIAYSELYFTDVFWPEFDKEAFYEAIVAYQSRERRFGKISDQVKKNHA